MTSTLTHIGGTVKQYSWHWQNQKYSVTYENLGQGLPRLLVTGTLDFVETREEFLKYLQKFLDNQ